MNEDIIEMISNAEKIKDDENHIFDELYVIQNIEKHESGYHFIEVYGKRKDEDKMYILTKCSDVIHFERVCEHAWFCSMDIPYFGIMRFFPRRHYRFLIPFTNISDFTIEFVGDK